MEPQEADDFQAQAQNDQTTGDSQQPPDSNLAEFHWPGLHIFRWSTCDASCAESWQPLEIQDSWFEVSVLIMAEWTGFSSKSLAPAWQCKHWAFWNPPGMVIGFGGVLTYCI